MSPNTTTTGASSEWNTWHELEDVFSSLGQLARSPVAPHEFYRTLLDECTRTLAASSGVVWLRAGATFQTVAQVRWSAADVATDEAARRAHESLLREAAQRREVTSVLPDAPRDDAVVARRSESLLLGPVHTPLDEGHQAALAVIEIVVSGDTSPAARRGSEQFLSTLCELAADYHAFNTLRRLQQDDDYRSQLLALSCHVHSRSGLQETAYALANEGRRLIGCDRLSVLVAHGRRSRLFAVSGISRIEKRSGAVRRIESLAELVRKADEPAYYADGQADALPPIATALEQYAEESHARQLAAVPVRPLSREAVAEDTAPVSRQHAVPRERPQFVLLAEQFDATRDTLHRDRLAEVAAACATALDHALQAERMPLGWLLRPLGNWKHRALTQVPRVVLALAAAAACVAALVFVQADFTVESAGTLQPTMQRAVFAPRSGLVDDVLVAHDTNVVAGQPLVRLRDPQLDLELKRVDGELETVARQIDAVRATRTNRQIRDAKPADSYRLSAEERELAQRQTNLRLELDLLQRERDALVVASPIAGRVLNWELGDRLAARPVERGEVLLTVADLAADWQLVLEVPDDRIGFIVAAQQELAPNLPVRFRLSSDDRQQHRGHIAEIARVVDVSPQAAAATPTIAVKVALDELNLDEAARRELRPGVSARAQIECGRAAVGYVWLHDIWDAAVEWMRF